jgi:hypothetical protein
MGGVLFYDAFWCSAFRWFCIALFVSIPSLSALISLFVSLSGFFACAAASCRVYQLRSAFSCVHGPGLVMCCAAMLLSDSAFALVLHCLDCSMLCLLPSL